MNKVESKLLEQIVKILGTVDVSKITEGIQRTAKEKNISNDIMSDLLHNSNHYALRDQFVKNPIQEALICIDALLTNDK